MPEFIIYSLVFAVMMVLCFLAGWFGRLSIGRADLKAFKPKTYNQEFTTENILEDMDDEFTPRPTEQRFDPFRYSEAGTPAEETGPDLTKDEFEG